MDPISPAQRPVLAVRRAIAAVAAAVRRFLRVTFQLISRDQLTDLSHQAERLGSASVESAAYVSFELQALDRRLSRLEEEISGLREALTADEPSR
jgi:predicted oxidoreductase